MEQCLLRTRPKSQGKHQPCSCSCCLPAECFWAFHQGCAQCAVSVPSGSRRGHGGAARGSSIPKGARPALVQSPLQTTLSKGRREMSSPRRLHPWLGGSRRKHIPSIITLCHSSAPCIPCLMPELSHLFLVQPPHPRLHRDSIKHL